MPGFYWKVVSNFASKMANFASQPRHNPTTDMWKYGDGITPQILKISSWNVNGIRSVLKKQKLQQYIKQFSPDILSINETKIDLKAFQKQQHSIVVEISKQYQYHQYWNFCKISSGYSGVATFSKFQPKSVIEDFQCSFLSLEGRCLTLEYEKFYLVNCYKPNSGPSLERLQLRTQLYDKKFQQFVNKLAKQKTVIICGDLNVAHKQIDLKNPQKNKKNAGFTNEERQSFNSLLQSGFTDSFRFLHPNKVKYTWWSTRSQARAKNIGWRIDYILSSNTKIIKQAVVSDEVEGSDHCPIHCIFDL